VFERFKNRNDKEFKVVADLDAMLVEPVAVVLHGQRHIIEPITTEKFMRFSIKFQEFQSLAQKKEVTPQEVIDGYYALISQVIPTITKSDIEKASEAQIGSLFGFVIKSITGELFAEKKTLKEAEAPVQSH
jgi:hypothetical protein